MRRLAALLFALGLALVPVASLAVEPGEILSDPKLEARAEAIGRSLRCLVCQNESIEASSADLAHDLRVLVRERLKAGDTDQQAIDYIVARYGEFVLLKPVLAPYTLVLWFAAPALFAAGALAIYLFARGRRAARAPAPMSEEEAAALRALDEDPGATSA